MPRAFLLSPASLGGRRAALLLNAQAAFDLAVRLRVGAVPIGEIFSFISGLYFRGKLAYSRRFAATDDAIRVITSDRGLVDPGTAITLADFRAMADAVIDHLHPPYRDPFVRDAATLADELGGGNVVLLGSVATDKYVAPLAAIFGARLHFPADFTGRGDMSRGGLLLQCAREGCELDYAPVMTSERHGARPPRLQPDRATPKAGRPRRRRARRTP
ncbi:MAG TPA: hypothetical protein VHW65_09245 [Gemmatimonadales bacterium]|jgi:hypothetical protein|nr:hypothetical protein [Gemmatimonadales bacterium]